MYDGYKAQRKGMPPELAQQVQPLKELLTALACDNTCHRAYNLLGVIALRSGRPEVAEKCFAAALALAPEETGYKKNLEITRNGIRGRASK